MFSREEEEAFDARARDSFHKWDLNHDGSLSMAELQAAPKDAHVPTTTYQVETLYKQLMAKNHESIQLDDFLIFAAQRRRALKKAFDSICRKGRTEEEQPDTFLTAGHLRRAAHRAGIPLSDRDQDPTWISGAYRKIISHSSGFRALWIGNGVNCVKIAPEMALKLYAFDAFKTAIAADTDNVSPMERFVAGGCAGALAEFSIYPIDVLRTRMATGLYPSVSGCARTVWKEGGVGAFYAGFVPSIVGIIPYAAIDLSINSLLKDTAAEHLATKGKEVSVPLLLGCGMISSATAATMTFPIIVVRTKAQASGLSMGWVIRTLWNEGVPGFYRGLAPSLMKVVPATSISYASYEWLNARWSS